MRRIVNYEIEFCNSACPHFYHNYEDSEKIWCALLDKKIRDENRDTFLIWGDMQKYDIPNECPLETKI